jgi:hypothetical protein
MRPAAVLIALALASAACSAIDAAPPVTVTPGRPFTLAVGAQAVLTQPALKLGFDSVVSDSRCPQGEQCIVAGEAVLRLWSQQGGQPRQWHVLHSGGNRPAPNIGGLALTLNDLAPPLMSGQPVARSAYRATLTLSEGSRTER